MDGAELLPRACFDVSPRVHEHPLTALSTNQTFSHITASGSSRVHNGNNYYITYDCSTGHGSPPMLWGEQQAVIEHASRSSQKRKRSVSDVSGITREHRERQTLSTVLESLGQFSKSVSHQSEGEHSEKIAAQLAVVLETFEQAASDGGDIGNLDRQVQDLKSQLSRAKRIEINAASPQAHTSRQYMAQSKFAKITSGQWKITLTTKILHSRSTSGRILTETCSALCIQPSLGFQGPYIAAFFGVSADVQRTITINPIVTAYNLVDDHAEVFRFVKDDDLDGLMKHLAFGRATIRDCDKNGRSLLHCACFHASPKICKFLVESGCDVDRAAKSHLAFIDWTITPVATFTFSHEKVEEDVSKRGLECQKILLQAGADPTLGIVDTYDETPEVESMIQMAMFGSSGGRQTTPFEQVLREGSAFFDVGSFRAFNGESLWMYACSNACQLSSPKILNILVRAGIQTNEINHRGWNCLFRCIQASQEPRTSNEFEALRYLLTVTHDIFAPDDRGRSIFDLVNESGVFSSTPARSYRRDLWYCALYRSGYAQRSKIPLPPPGHLALDNWYRPAHYRALMYLNAWDFGFSEARVPDYYLVDKKTLSQHERDAAPGLGEWDPSDLVMMEGRISRAIYQDN